MSKKEKELEERIEKLEKMLEEALEASSKLCSNEERIGSLIQIAKRGLPIGSEERNNYDQCLKDFQKYTSLSQSLSKEYTRYTYQTLSKSSFGGLLSFGDDDKDYKILA